MILGIMGIGTVLGSKKGCAALAEWILRFCIMQKDVEMRVFFEAKLNMIIDLTSVSFFTL
jgi:hypothetical protein